MWHKSCSVITPGPIELAPDPFLEQCRRFQKSVNESFETAGYGQHRHANSRKPARTGRVAGRCETPCTCLHPYIDTESIGRAASW